MQVQEAKDLGKIKNINLNDAEIIKNDNRQIAMAEVQPQTANRLNGNQPISE